MKAILSEDSTRVMQEPTAESISMTSLQKGDEFEVGKVIRKRKEVWVEAILPSGVTGYISGGTKIFAIKRVEATGNPLDMYESPDESSRIHENHPQAHPVHCARVRKDRRKGLVLDRGRYRD